MYTQINSNQFLHTPNRHLIETMMYFQTVFKGNMWVTVICLALSHSLSVYLSVCLSIRCAYAGLTDLHFVYGEDSLLQEDVPVHHTFSISSWDRSPKTEVRPAGPQERLTWFVKKCRRRTVCRNFLTDHFIRLVFTTVKILKDFLRHHQTKADQMASHSSLNSSWCILPP